MKLFKKVLRQSQLNVQGEPKSHELHTK